MKIAIIGCGVIGGALFNWFKENTEHDLKVYDPPLGFNDDLNECDVAFISVPVNIKSFKQDLSIIEESIKLLGKYTNVFIRSTVLPGTCDELSKKFNMNIHSMPEFLTERRAQDDMDNNKTIFIGHSCRLKVFPELKGLYNLLERVFLRKKEIVFKTSKECEMGKYMHNLFGAFKVTYFNCMNHLCEKNDINFNNAKDIIFNTGFINKEHTLVPGPDSEKGFGGKCFPPNIEAFIGYANNDPTHKFFSDVYLLNRWFRGFKDISK